MKKTNKILSLILCFLLTFPATVYAEETPPTPSTGIDLGSFTLLKKQDKAPFTGFLINQTGMAKLLAETEFKLQQMELRHQFSLQSTEALWKLKYDNSQASLTSLQEKHDSLLTIKDNEIKRLSDIALDSPNDYSVWWFVGGVVLGVGLTIGVVYGVAETIEN